MTTKIFDIVKSVFLIALAIFIFIEVPKVLDKFGSNSNNKVDQTTIENIARNVAVATISESNRSVSELVTILKSQNSQALVAVNKLGEKVQEVGKIQGELRGQIKEISEGTYTKDYEVTLDSKGKETTGARDIADTTVKFTSTNGAEYPVAVVRYSPNLEKESDRWSTQPLSLKYKANIIATTDADGNPKRYVEAWVESPTSTLGWEKDSTGAYVVDAKGNRVFKKFPVDLTIEDWAKTEEQVKSFRFGPRLNFTGAITNSGVYPALGVSLFSYGTTKRDMDWTFAQFYSGGTDNNFYLGFSPFLWNIGNVTPLIENLFIGPTMSVDKNSNTTYGAIISVPF